MWYFFDARKNWFPFRVLFPRARPYMSVSGVGAPVAMELSHNAQDLSELVSKFKL